MLKTKIIVLNLIKSENLVNLINRYTLNVFSMYKKNHDIDLTFDVRKIDLDHFELIINGIVDGRNTISKLYGDDLIPMIDILTKKFRDKTLITN